MKTAVNYVLFVENVIESKDGKLTLVNIFDSVNAKSFPTQRNSIYAVASVQVSGVNEGEELSFTVKILASDDAVLGENPIQDFKAPGLSSFGINLIVNAGPMRFEVAGKYKFQFLMNGKVIAEKALSATGGSEE